MRDDFAVFICTHGRPDAQHTLNRLLSTGYTGKWYLVLDDQDDTIQKYIDNFGKDHIIVFDKNYMVSITDTGTNEPPFKCIIYAKNAVEQMAKDFGLTAFVVADDDIINLRYRYVDGSSLRSEQITCNMDEILSAYVDALLECNMAATSFGFAQFYFTGVNSFCCENFQKYRVPYNFVFRNVSISVDWKSSFGEDIVTALYFGKLGQFWTALPYVQMEIKPLGKESGGMYEVYHSYSDVKLAMFDFMYLPTATRPLSYKGKFMASIRKENSCPRLISSRYKK